MEEKETLLISVVKPFVYVQPVAFDKGMQDKITLFSLIICMKWLLTSDWLRAVYRNTLAKKKFGAKKIILYKKGELRGKRLNKRKFE